MENNYAQYKKHMAGRQSINYCWIIYILIWLYLIAAVLYSSQTRWLVLVRIQVCTNLWRGTVLASLIDNLVKINRQK